MLHFIQTCGFFGWPLTLVALVEVGLALRLAGRFIRGAAAGPETAGRINTILFWGFVAAVMGFLGQAVGIYNAMRVIATAEAVAPNLVAQGFAESFTTTVFGLTILLMATLVWLGLRAWNGRVQRELQAA